MNVEEAKEYIKKKSSDTYTLQVGMVAGAAITILILGLSIVRSHIQIILNYGGYVIVALLLPYLVIVRIKLGKAEKILKEEKEHA